MNKKILFTFAITLLIQQFTHAQITIESTNLPSVGESYVVAKDTLDTARANIDVGSASNQAQVWDFTKLAPIPDGMDTVEYLDKSQSPYDMPPSADSADMLLKINNPTGLSELQGLFSNAFIFLNKEQDGIYGSHVAATIGTSDIVIFNTKEPEQIYAAPITYNDSITDTAYYYGSIPNSNFLDSLTRGITKTIKVDAFGTLQLPQATFNVLRIYEVAISNDTTWMNGVPTNNTKSTTYNYYFVTDSQGVNQPVVSVNVSAAGVPQQALFLYEDTSTSIKKIAFNNALKLYPNPVHDLVTIETANLNGKHNLVFYNNLGQAVFTENININGPDFKKTIQLNQLKSGIYFYDLKDAAGRQIKAGKFIIQ